MFPSDSVMETDHPNISTIDISDIREDETTTTETTNKNKRKASPRWKFTDNMVEALLDNLISYKNEMTYQGHDFQADLVTCYGEVRQMMALMFPLNDFGPGIIATHDTELMEPNELVQYKRRIERLEKMKKDGYTRVKAKIKELRAGYKVAIDKGTRSGSGRLIHDNFDKLQEIWGGNPSVTSISNVHCSQEPSTNDKENEPIDDSEEDDDANTAEPRKTVRDTKRDNMKKNISAHQREMLQIDLGRQELDLKKESIKVMRESAKSTEVAIKEMTNSITNIGQSIRDGLGLLASSMIQCQQMNMANNTPFFQANQMLQNFPMTPTNGSKFMTSSPSTTPSNTSTESNITQ